MKERYRFMQFTSIFCPICGKSYSPEKWETIASRRSRGLALLWESFGRGTLTLLKRIFCVHEVEDEIEPVKEKLLKAVRDFYNSGVLTREDLSDLLNDLIENDEITAYTRAKPSFTAKSRFYEPSSFNL